MNKIKISTKLFLLVFISSLVLTSFGIYSLNNLSSVNSSLESIYRDRVLNLKYLNAIAENYGIKIINTIQKMSDGSIDFKTGERRIIKSQEDIKGNWKNYQTIYATIEEKKLAAEVERLMQNTDETYDQLRSAIHKEDKTSLMTISNHVLNPQIDPLLVKVVQLIEVQLTEAEQQYKNGEAIYSSAKTASAIFVLLGITISVVISTALIKSIRKSINEASAVVATLSEGNLTANISDTNEDEIGMLLKNLKGMIDRFKEIIQYVNSASNNIVAASQELSSSSQQMSEGATEQAAATEQVSSSMEQMTANVQQNSDNAAQTKNIAIKASADAINGSTAVNEAVCSMKTIADKITIISEIARQTNILALNAAVEAARAGDQGRGFAVVAAEVRKLAEKTQVAANEIIQQTKSGVAIAEKSGNLLDAIVPNVQRTATLVEEISASNAEQNLGAAQINNALQQLNQVTQQNAATSEEIAASAEELSSQADQLKEIISFFKLESSLKQQPAFVTQPTPYRKTSRDNTIRNKKANHALQYKSNGVLLNMDTLDNEYEKF
jgi:methyl-accepting chemotaxis protein